MKTKPLSELLAGISFSRTGEVGDPGISNISYDSRGVFKGTLFFAIAGTSADGHDYIPQAVKNGAVAVIHSRELGPKVSGSVFIKVENSRVAMSPVSANFFDHPSTRLRLAGVTGTDGKSTTVSLLHQLLTLSGHRTGLVSTVHFNTGEGDRVNALRHSTPEPPEIQGLLWQMVKAGCTYGVLEATSHGLSSINNRLGDVSFDVGILTNIGHEHLEFHKTRARYIEDKARLFSSLPREGWGIVNEGEPEADTFRQSAGCNLASYSLKPGRGDLWAKDIRTDDGYHQHCILGGEGEGSTAKLRLPGLFNVENMMAALLGASRMTGEAVASFVPFIPKLLPVKGRMVDIELGQPFRVLVDYAHTPGSFERVLPLIREQTTGKLIVLFGSAGERDTEKRAILGRIASIHAEKLVITNEDPRGEDPDEILNQIASGCSGLNKDDSLFIIPDRIEAIHHALALAQPGDAVVFLGKGHEGTIVTSEGALPWDEEVEVSRALVSMGFGG